MFVHNESHCSCWCSSKEFGLDLVRSRIYETRQGDATENAAKNQLNC
jgi:hypothetical protein